MSALDGTHWKPVDLGPYLRGEVKRTEPTVGVKRTDGLPFLYRAKEHSIIGEMECGKSWFLLACASAEIQRGNQVLYIHFEESDPGDTVERLQALGLSDDKIIRGLDFIGPDTPITSGILSALTEPPPALVILDGINEAMSLHANDIRDENGVAQFRARLVKPFTAVGAAVIGADHVVKDTERRGRGPLGSIHKGNALNGALILLENREPFGRGQRGVSRVYVTKDRPGYLRRHGQPDRKVPGKTYMGDLVVDDTRDRVSYLDLHVFPPIDSPDAEMKANTSLCDLILTTIASTPTQSVESVAELIAHLQKANKGAKRSSVLEAIEILKIDGKIKEVLGHRGRKEYHLLTHSRITAA